MRDRYCEVDVTHPLAADDGARDFDAAFLADDAVVTDSLIFAAEALEVLGGTENTLAEESVRLRTLRAVVDGFRLGHLAAGPAEDILGAGDGQCDGIERIGCAGNERHTVRKEGIDAGLLTRGNRNQIIETIHIRKIAAPLQCDRLNRAGCSDD